MRRFLVQGDSMAPALSPGDSVYCRSRGLHIERGDYVVFRHPRRRAMTLIKRVVGLAGETVVIDTGVVLINGREDTDQWNAGLTSPDGEWIVGLDEVFVLSDNRSATRDDSRSFGPIPRRKVRRVVRIARVGGDRDAGPQLPYAG